MANDLLYEKLKNRIVLISKAVHFIIQILFSSFRQRNGRNGQDLKWGESFIEKLGLQ